MLTKTDTGTQMHCPFTLLWKGKDWKNSTLSRKWQYWLIPLIQNDFFLWMHSRSEQHGQKCICLLSLVLFSTRVAQNVALRFLSSSMRLSIHLSVFLPWNVSALLTFFINSIMWRQFVRELIDYRWCHSPRWLPYKMLKWVAKYTRAAVNVPAHVKTVSGKHFIVNNALPS